MKYFIGTNANDSSSLFKQNFYCNTYLAFRLNQLLNYLLFIIESHFFYRCNFLGIFDFVVNFSYWHKLSELILHHLKLLLLHFRVRNRSQRYCLKSSVVCCVVNMCYRFLDFTLVEYLSFGFRIF